MRDEGIRIEISCWNSNCKNYFEDMCLKVWGKNEPMFLDKEGKCKQFEAGKNEGYTQNVDNDDKEMDCLVCNLGKERACADCCRDWDNEEEE